MRQFSVGEVVTWIPNLLLRYETHGDYRIIAVMPVEARPCCCASTTLTIFHAGMKGRARIRPPAEGTFAFAHGFSRSASECQGKWPDQTLDQRSGC